MTRKFIFAITSLLVIVMTTSCVTKTNVWFYTETEGAEVFIDGKNVGTTPVQVSMSNGIWSDPSILLKKEGYKDLHANVVKEPKVVNILCGVLIWSPSLLWCYGPKQEQHYMLQAEKNILEKAVSQE